MSAADLDPFDASIEATGELWARVARPFDVGETVDALLGLSAEIVEQLIGVLVSTCEEAEALLEAMPRILRTLKTSVGSHNVRCFGEIRGPVQWSETFAAQASSLGNRDVYVCTSTRRAYDIDENRVLVAALRAIASAGASIDVVGEPDDEGLHAARHNAKAARRYLDHRTLEGIQVGARPTPREMKRTRGGKTSRSYRPALRMLDRVGEPLTMEELAPYCDRRTRVQHGVLLSVIRKLEQRGLKIPPLRAEGGSLFAGPVEFIHPRLRGDRTRLHGIVVGSVLIDVAERLTDDDPEAVRAQLAARSHGRQVVPVLRAADVDDAVDHAVATARGGS